MLVSAAITEIRNRTGHDVDGQVNDTTMLLPWVEREARRVRRELSSKIPQLFTLTGTGLTIAAGQQTISKSATILNVERILEVHRLVRGTGSNPASDEWVDLPVYEQDAPWLGWREEGDFLFLYPGSVAPGTYRTKHVQAMSTAAFTTSTELNGAFSATIVGLPMGLEEVVIERVCAIVAARVPGDDPAPHREEAERVWESQLRALRQRYGRSVKPGFRRLSRFA